MKKNKLLCLFTFFIFGCDFTPYYLKYIEQGQDFLKNQKYKEATIVYKKILKENPPVDILIRVNFQLGEIYSIYLNEPSIALKYYKKIIEIAEDPIWSVKSKEKIANIYYSLIKNFSLSKSSYKQLLEFRPKLKNRDLYIYRYLNSYFLMGDYSNLQKLVQLNISQVTEVYETKIYYIYLLSYYYQKKYKICIEHILTYLKLKLNPSEILTANLILANSYESLEELETAYNIYYQLKKNYPNYKVIENRLLAIFNRKVSRKR